MFYEGNTLLESWWRQIAGRERLRRNLSGQSTARPNQPCSLRNTHTDSIHANREGPYPYISLSGDGFSCIQVNHLRRAVRKGCVPVQHNNRKYSMKVCPVQKSSTARDFLPVIHCWFTFLLQNIFSICSFGSKRSVFQSLNWCLKLVITTEYS